jgi:hypothetical protein
VPLADVKKKWGDADDEVVDLHTPRVQEHDLASRCYHINYVLVLLRDVYRFGRSEKKLYFIDKIDNMSLDWPLGAFVYTQAHGDTVKPDSSGEGGKADPKPDGVKPDTAPDSSTDTVTKPASETSAEKPETTFWDDLPAPVYMAVGFFGCLGLILVCNKCSQKVNEARERGSTAESHQNAMEMGLIEKGEGTAVS